MLLGVVTPIPESHIVLTTFVLRFVRAVFHHLSNHPPLEHFTLLSPHFKHLHLTILDSIIF